MHFLRCKLQRKQSQRCAFRLEELPSKLKGMVRSAKKAEAEITTFRPGNGLTSKSNPRKSN
jgi:hypothetical protein